MFLLLSYPLLGFVKAREKDNSPIFIYVLINIYHDQGTLRKNILNHLFHEQRVHKKAHRFS